MHDAKGEQDQNTLDSQGRSSERARGFFFFFWSRETEVPYSPPACTVCLCVVGKDEEDGKVGNASMSDHLP